MSNEPGRSNPFQRLADNPPPEASPERLAAYRPASTGNPPEPAAAAPDDDALLAARTDVDLLAALAPADRIPSPADLADWLPECPPDAAAEAAALLAAVFDDGRHWHWRIIDGDHLVAFGPAVPPSGTPDDMGYLANLRTVHCAWCDLPAPRPRHPLTPLVRAWADAPLPAAWDERRHPVMPGALAGREGGTRTLHVVSGDLRQLALGFNGTGQTEPATASLPGIEPVQPAPVPVLPFVAPYDRAGGASMTQGGGAAHALRLFVETLMAVPPELRRTDTGPPASLTCTLRQLVGALWPRGWQRARDWPRLVAGIAGLNRLGVEWERSDGHGGIWYTVTVRSAPRDGALLDDVFRFEVLLPPGSTQGPMVDRTHLRLLGLDSAVAFRLYLALCWLWDAHGTYDGRLIGATVPEVERDTAGYVLDARGEIVTERGGRPTRRATHKRAVQTGGRIINPAAMERYPALSPDDLAVMAYAPADLAADGSARRRDQRRVARKALDLIAKLTGAAIVPAERPDGVTGCVRVLPPATHKAAHDAAVTARTDARRR